jgi:hypothetical protein
MAVRDLIAAFEVNDQLAIRRLGWWDVWEAAATWWAPKQTARAKDLAPYARLLGDERPDDIIEAFKALSGDWRPTPAQVRGYLNGRRREKRVDAGRCRNPAMEPPALEAVASALREGERGCECGVHRSTWRIDAVDVLRCKGCGGLEHGQLYAAEDANLTEAVA